MRRIHPHSYTSYRRILKTRWGMLGYQLFLNVSVVYSIQYTVHHISVSVSFTLLIKTFCTPPGGNSVPKTYLINLKFCGFFRGMYLQNYGFEAKPLTAWLKKNRWGFLCWEFSREGKQQPVYVFFVPSRENASLSPQKKRGIDI